MKLLFWKKEDLNTGRLGEKIAANFLKKKGYKIVEMNFKNPSGRRLGEIDVIAKEGKELVFVEVKTRDFNGKEKSLPEESITPAKLAKLNKAAQFYIKSNSLWDTNYRFDAISIWLKDNKEDAEIKHIKSIFY